MWQAIDISDGGELLSRPKGAKHDNTRFGTHQARDAHHLFKTLGLDLGLYSSEVKLNSEYMDVSYFNLRLRCQIFLEEVIQRLKSNRRIKFTQKDLSSLVFSFDRDHGLFRRAPNQIAVPLWILSGKEMREVIGFGASYQHGSPLLSNIAAAEWFLYPEDYEKRLRCIEDHFFFRKFDRAAISSN